MDIQRQKNFGLSEEEFNKLLLDLQDGDEALFKKAFLSSFESGIKFLQRKCGIPREKAYDAYMDALLLFRQKCLNGKISYGNLRYLLSTMSFQIYLKKKSNVTELTNYKSAAGHNKMDEMIGVEEKEMMKKAWAKLGATCKDLLTEFYYNKIHLSELACEYDKNPAAMRKQKQRCLGQLRSLFQRFAI